MAKSKPSSEDEDILEEAKKRFERADEAEADNRTAAEADIKFARLEDQWPADILTMRKGRPSLVIPILAPVIRQVVNDCRQNKPAIKVGPVDSGADVETASVYSDLIRNIEQQSSADIAYDTGVDSAVTGGFGYWRIGLDYAHDDSFDMDLTIQRILDPMSVWGDPDDLGADSANWNVAFVVDWIPKDKFEADFGDAGKIDWDAAGYTGAGDKWFNDEKGVRVAEYWTREEVEKNICLLSDGTVISKEDLEAEQEGLSYQDFLASQGVMIQQERTAKSWKVVQRRLTGAELLPMRELSKGKDGETKTSRDWPGKYIPIVPVYGDEIYSEGKRHLRSLIRDAKDAQRNFNYWRSAATELVALAPRAPYIGAEGFKAADSNWSRANQPDVTALEYTPVPGQPPPQRQPMDTGAAAGALQEALNASDDIKRITGIYDASLGARSNETSGKAIMARQREGDVSTFHFIDNLNRAIAHTGRILIDLIPHVYSQRRILRVLGEDGNHKMVPLKQPIPSEGPDGKPQMQPAPPGPDGMPPMQMGQNGPEPVMIPITHIIDLAAGKYDLTVKSGPSYTSKREEAATALTEAIRNVPAAAPILLPELFQNLDLPGADKIAAKMEALAPKPDNGPPKEFQDQMAKAKEAFDKVTAERDQLKEALKAASDKSQQAQGDMAMKAMGLKAEAAKIKVSAFAAETDRFKVMSDAHINWTQLGIDMHLELADLEMAHAASQQHGLEQGNSGSGAAPAAGQGAAGIPRVGAQPLPQPPASPMQPAPPRMPSMGQGAPPMMPNAGPMPGLNGPPPQMPMNGPMPPQGMPPGMVASRLQDDSGLR